MSFKLFGTTADVGVESAGKDLKEAFEEQAAGMFSIMTDLEAVEPRLSFDVEATGNDLESLLVAWLNELLFIYDVKKVFLRSFEIKSFEEGRLKAGVRGEEIDPARHPLKTEVKAVTYHMLDVRQSDGGYVTRVVYDI